MDMVSPCAPGFALWNKLTFQDQVPPVREVEGEGKPLLQVGRGLTDEDVVLQERLSWERLSWEGRGDCAIL